MEKLVVLDLRTTNEGVTCEEYSILMMGLGHDKSKIPSAILERMEQHRKACTYHDSPGFYQSVLGTNPDDFEEGASEIVEKYQSLQ